jgi:uncharacterized protein (DUF433 family)
MQTYSVTHTGPKILDGTAVFLGTRVPVQSLIGDLAARHSLSDFLDDFPSLSHEQATTVLEPAKVVLLSTSQD